MFLGSGVMVLASSSESMEMGKVRVMSATVGIVRVVAAAMSAIMNTATSTVMCMMRGVEVASHVQAVVITRNQFGGE